MSWNLNKQRISWSIFCLFHACGLLYLNFSVSKGNPGICWLLNERISSYKCLSSMSLILFSSNIHSLLQLFHEILYLALSILYLCIFKYFSKKFLILLIFKPILVQSCVLFIFIWNYKPRRFEIYYLLIPFKSLSNCSWIHHSLDQILLKIKFLFI